MKRYLLINPWIYDFAVYDYGIRPVGLLRIAEYLRRLGGEIYFIDCLENCSRNKDKFGFSKLRKEKIEKPYILRKIQRPYFRYGISISDFLTRLDSINTVDEIYITSGMTYWYPGIQLVTSLIRKKFKSAPILLGGIYATLSHRHACKTSGADIVVRGPFLGKEYFLEPHFYPAYDLLSNKEILALQLTSGCPYRCTYCASRMLTPQFQIKDPINLFEEVMYYNRTFGTKIFIFYDDALTVNSAIGLKKFLRLVTASGKEFIFHTPNGLHARFIDEELAELFKRANFKELRLSLETSDEALQEFTGGKVTNNELKRAIRNLREAGYTKSDIGVYILIGAPWLTLEKTRKDILFVNSLGAKAVLASYSPIPSTPDFRMLVRYKIIKADIDPLWHNKTIFCELLEPSYIEKVREMRLFTANLNKS